MSDSEITAAIDAKVVESNFAADADERHLLAELIWNVSRRDEGTISATGANIVAGAVLAAGYSRTPDAHLRERGESDD